MADPRLILCGGLRVADTPRGWRQPDRLTLEIGTGEDVHLAVAQLTERMRAGVPGVSMDLLEIAAYVFAADQALTRGGVVKFDYGDSWRRKLRFVIPVRCLAVWQRPAIQLALVAALEFLTDDEFEFEFRQATDPAMPEQYLVDCVAPSGTEFQEVILFSGGLDSLCGAVEQLLVKGHRGVLVSHRSSSRVFGRQQALFNTLHQLATEKSRPLPLHVNVTVNKGKDHNRDFNQRSRSFVFASIAAVVARQIGLPRIQFYENGCTSLNLPVSPELIGARASRTTHPQTLALFGELFSLLFDVPFQVQSPYQLCTKSEILGRLREQGHADLCKLTCSCGTVWGAQEDRPHCGHCSQCVERRVSVLAAGLTDEQDPPGRYASDPLTGERDGPGLTFAERYVGTAREVEKIASARAFAIRYPEVNAAIPYVGGNAAEAAGSIHDLCRRNAADACRAIRGVMNANIERLFQQEIPARSLIGVTLGRTVAPGKPTPSKPSCDSGFVVDRDKFEVRWNGRHCPLGKTLEFELLEHLNLERDKYVTTQQIADQVWKRDSTTNNSIQRVVSSIRRQLLAAEFVGVGIDGDEDGHYRLVVPDC